jgi:hypothetical protein
VPEGTHTDTELIALQRDLCERFGVLPEPSPVGLKVGVGRTVGSGVLPLNGLRHRPEGETTGWYIWAGPDLPGDAAFFQPVHVEHLVDICPEALPYLALPPGWRFLIAPDQEDVWKDRTLLET